MVQKKESTDLSKFVRRTRGRYVVTTMPEPFGPFIAEELVAELRRRRPAATLEDIAADCGESFVNFWRYRKGKPVPLGKARRFTRRLRDLHFAAVERLERLAQSHPRGHQAAELLRTARRAYDEAYEGMAAALDEREDIVWTERIAAKLKRIQADAESLTQEYDRASLRLERLRLDLPRLEEAIRAGIYKAL